MKARAMKAEAVNNSNLDTVDGLISEYYRRTTGNERRRDIIKQMFYYKNTHAIDQVLYFYRFENDTIKTDIIKEFQKRNSSVMELYLLFMLYDDIKEIRLSAFEVLLWGLRGRRYCEKIVEIFRSSNKWQTRKNGVEFTVYIKGKQSHDALIHALNDKHYVVRYTAAEVIACTKDRDMVDLLVCMMTDPVPIVRVFVAEALGDIGDSKAENVLLNSVVNDTNALVRGYAAESLVNIKSRNAVDTITHRLNSETHNHAKVRYYFALFQLGEHEYVSNIIWFLKSKSRSVRRATTNTLADILTERRLNRHLNKGQRNDILIAFDKVLKSEKDPDVRSTIEDVYYELGIEK